MYRIQRFLRLTSTPHPYGSGTSGLLVSLSISTPCTAIPLSDIFDIEKCSLSLGPLPLPYAMAPMVFTVNISYGFVSVMITWRKNSCLPGASTIFQMTSRLVSL